MVTRKLPRGKDLEKYLFDRKKILNGDIQVFGGPGHGLIFSDGFLGEYYEPPTEWPTLLAMPQVVHITWTQLEYNEDSTEYTEYSGDVFVPPLPPVAVYTNDGVKYFPQPYTHISVRNCRQNINGMGDVHSPEEMWFGATRPGENTYSRSLEYEGTFTATVSGSSKIEKIGYSEAKKESEAKEYAEQLSSWLSGIRKNRTWAQYTYKLEWDDENGASNLLPLPNNISGKPWFGVDLLLIRVCGTNDLTKNPESINKIGERYKSIKAHFYRYKSFTLIQKYKTKITVENGDFELTSRDPPQFRKDWDATICDGWHGKWSGGGGSMDGTDWLARANAALDAKIEKARGKPGTPGEMGDEPEAASDKMIQNMAKMINASTGEELIETYEDVSLDKLKSIISTHFNFNPDTGEDLE